MAASVTSGFGCTSMTTFIQCAYGHARAPRLGARLAGFCQFPPSSGKTWDKIIHFVSCIQTCYKQNAPLAYSYQPQHETKRWKNADTCCPKSILRAGCYTSPALKKGCQQAFSVGPDSVPGRLAAQHSTPLADKKTRLSLASSSL